MKTFVFDCEGDGLNPSKFHCLAANNLGNDKDIVSTTSYASMKKLLTTADVLIGHNIIRWDIPNLERVLGIKIEAKLVDTLSLSWYLYPDRLRHGLEFWGEDFGVPKPVIDDWYNLSVDEYIHRCKEDVRINTRLWDKQWKHLMRIYNDENECWRFIEYLSFKMDCAAEQERSGWRLDVEKAEENAEAIQKEFDMHTEALKKAMPEVPVYVKKKRPAKPFKKDGTHSAHGEAWFSLLKERGLPEDYDQEIKVVKKYEEPNPNSSDQVKAWLYTLGWEPSSFKYKREDDGSFRKIPQIRVDGDDGKELCPSVKLLSNADNGIRHLQHVTVLSHRLGILRGFLSSAVNGVVLARVQGLTNTLRFKHTEIVNLPGALRAYGEQCRGVLIAPDGYELCGSDMSSLEDRTKQHYMWPYDPEYVKEMNTKGFDPHLDIAVLAKMMTQENVDAYKGGDKSWGSVRHDAKTVNYSCTYGVTPKGIVRNSGMELGRATNLHSTFWERNWSIKQIADDCVVKTVGGVKWLYNPVSGFWYNLRAEKDRFSTLNQGTGVYCFDLWVMEVRKVRPQLTAQFHDEIVLCVKKGFREQAKKLLKAAIQKVNDKLKLNRELDVDVQFGDNYAQIH